MVASESWSAVFCKDVVDISYENASFGVLDDSIWLDLIYFLTTNAFWLMKYFFRIDGDNLGVSAANKDLTPVFVAQISHYEKFTALHKLISIVLQLTNQIKQTFPAKSCGARAIFLKFLWGRGWSVRLTELSNITFLMRSFKEKNIQKKQVDYKSDQLSYLTSKTLLSMYPFWSASYKIFW